MTAEAELMPIPLWHGTSSWFLPGIMEHGLGAVDVHAQLRSREFFRAAWELRLQLAPPEEQQKLREGYGWQARAIIDDAVTGGGFNYRYGGVYCFGMAGRAVSFASRGYGSEMVRLGAAWLEEIQPLAPEAANALVAEFPEVAACLAHEHKPIIIRLDGIQLGHVRMENGRVIPPQLVEMPKAIEGGTYEVTAPPNRASMSVFRPENVELGFAFAERFDLVLLQEAN